MILCGSRLRPPVRSGPTPLVRLARDAGFQAIAVDGGCTLRELLPLRAEAAELGLALATVRAPLPEAPPAEGKRLPYLAALGDKEERLAAVALTRRTLEVARELGATVFALHVGRVELAVRERDIRAAFQRRELGEGEPGYRLWRVALDERLDKTQAVLDATRAALDRLLPVVVGLDARLVLVPAAGPWEAPSPREALELLREYRGAPISVLYSAARLAVLGALGLPASDERRAALRDAAGLLEASDAVGLEHPLLPGQGEVDQGELTGLGLERDLVLVGPSDATVDEVGRARDDLEAQIRRTASPAGP